MSSLVSRSILIFAALAAAVIAALWLFDEVQSRKPIEMSRVGGTENACVCTHRLEP